MWRSRCPPHSSASLERLRQLHFRLRGLARRPPPSPLAPPRRPQNRAANSATSKATSARSHHNERRVALVFAIEHEPRPVEQSHLCRARLPSGFRRSTRPRGAPGAPWRPRRARRRRRRGGAPGGAGGGGGGGGAPTGAGGGAAPIGFSRAAAAGRPAARRRAAWAAEAPPPHPRSSRGGGREETAERRRRQRRPRDGWREQRRRPCPGCSCGAGRPAARAAATGAGATRAAVRHPPSPPAAPTGTMHEPRRGAGDGGARSAARVVKLRRGGEVEEAAVGRAAVTGSGGRGLPCWRGGPAAR